MTNTSTTTMALVPAPSRPAMGRRSAGESSSSRSARCLADAARAFRDASDAQHDPEDLAVAFALVGAALDDLAAGAELAAYATMERTRRRAMGPTDGLPLATARALSWRLHGLRSRLADAHGICAEVTGVLDVAARR